MSPFERPLLPIEDADVGVEDDVPTNSDRRD
jgi:hypothetical protein